MLNLRVNYHIGIGTTNVIFDISRLQVLSMGGNQLNEIHPAIGQLRDLKALILSDNQLESLPAAIANLKHLKTLQLHKNRLRTLPTEIITLNCLSEVGAVNVFS